ncbi:RRM domain-containing protein [Phanerochaete sordida]|uniref:RRM domain-containing protein n=1 Tax=Phanerochaete sordida TaxID=48140 RepID=A0A9P3LGN3_9APHY|nr:RRM domain-containing protein [Phanerochaete sordida]
MSDPTILANASASATALAASAAPPTIAAGSSAQAQAAAFADDPRVHFDRQAGTWRFEDDDGNEMEYDAAKGAWVPVLSEDLLKAQQAAYSVPGVDEETPAAPVLKRAKKRKEPEDFTSDTTGQDPGPSKKGKKGKSNGEKPKSKNTAVYVTGLPPDTDHDELVERFSKCGLIEEGDDGEPKIKMYARDDGSFSGEALIVYFKEESVMLAENILDDAELRIGEPATRMSVRKADFSHKHESGSVEGSADAKPRKTVDKKRATRRIGKMVKKLGEWDDEDGFGPSLTEEDKIRAENRTSRVVVLKHMFTLKELDEDASLLLDLKEDVREECETLGEVTNVVLYDKEPEGIMTVKFRDPLSAQACVIKMNGRFFAGRRIEASVYAGKQRFKRSGGHEEIEGEGDEAEKRRLDDFAQWLMTEGD